MGRGRLSWVNFAFLLMQRPCLYLLLSSQMRGELLSTGSAVPVELPAALVSPDSHCRALEERWVSKARRWFRAFVLLLVSEFIAFG